MYARAIMSYFFVFIYIVVLRATVCDGRECEGSVVKKRDKTNGRTQNTALAPWHCLRPYVFLVVKVLKTPNGRGRGGGVRYECGPAITPRGTGAVSKRVS